MQDNQAKHENKQARGFHGYYTVGNTTWRIDDEGDIRDGEMLIAEPSYLSRDGKKNAAMIAAAPELLFELENCRDRLARLKGLGSGRDSWLKDMDKAIAKARGETPDDTINPPSAVVPPVAGDDADDTGDELPF